MKPTVFNDKPIVFVRDPNAGCIDCAGGSRSGLFDICSHCSGGIFKYAEDTENAPNIPVKHLMCTCGAGLLLRGGSRTTFTEVCPACGVNQRYIQDTKNAPEPSLKEHISFLEHQLKTVTQANKDIAEELKKANNTIHKLKQDIENEQSKNDNGLYTRGRDKVAIWEEE